MPYVHGWYILFWYTCGTPVCAHQWHSCGTPVDTAVKQVLLSCMAQVCPTHLWQTSITFTCISYSEPIAFKEMHTFPESPIYLISRYLCAIIVWHWENKIREAFECELKHTVSYFLTCAAIFEECCLVVYLCRSYLVLPVVTVGNNKLLKNVWKICTHFLCLPTMTLYSPKCWWVMKTPLMVTQYGPKCWWVTKHHSWWLNMAQSVDESQNITHGDSVWPKVLMSHKTSLMVTQYGPKSWCTTSNHPE